MRMRGGRVAALLVGLLAAPGCAHGNYTVLVAPRQAIEAYRAIRVEPVTVEITTDSIAQSDLIEIRRSLMDAIAEEDHVQSVVAEGEGGEGWLGVECAVTAFEKGSRAGRWLLGRFGGAAVLGLQCAFRDLASGSVVGSADFEEEVTGGLFGGGADATGMGGKMAKDVADYLKRGGKRED
jgi:hypothetical protein